MQRVIAKKLGQKFPDSYKNAKIIIGPEGKVTSQSRKLPQAEKRVDSPVERVLSVRVLTN